MPPRRSPPQRISVVGCGGAGKSSLARAIALRLSLPVIHLDAHYWHPGWIPTPDPEWEARQPGLFAGERWVADGNYHRTLPHRTARSDLIVFLDLPRAACLRGVLTRLLRHRGEVRPDMAPGCPESADLEFLRWVWRFRRDTRPKVLAHLRAFRSSGGEVVVLRSRPAVAAFLRRLGRRGAHPAR